LEISEKDAEDLGLTWNTILSFQEKTIPTLFNVGTFARITQLQADLNALITHNQARILANPTLLTKSSFEATFAVGGEIPYPTVGQGGVQGVEYKKYGVILKILPVITPRKTIDAQINVTVSNPDSANSIKLNNITVPAIASRDAGSKVEVQDGETVVLAGIKQSNRSKTTTRIPFLGSIPILGLLFRSTSESVTQTSLVIFVTFRLIK
jgi:pilus assembly protein CpaC